MWQTDDWFKVNCQISIVSRNHWIELCSDILQAFDNCCLGLDDLLLLTWRQLWYALLRPYATLRQELDFSRCMAMVLVQNLVFQ